MDQISTISPDREVVFADFGRRLGASLIDGIIIWIISASFNYTIDGETFSHTLSAIVFSLTTGWLYEALMTSSKEQATVGKIVMKIRVTDVDGNRISFGRATGRHFAQNISVLIIFLGFLMMLWDSKNQTLHDKLAKTYVIRG